MASLYDEVDAALSWNGDIGLSEQGDIKDTSFDTLQSLLDQIHSIVASQLLDWEIYPNRGAGLDDFTGEANTRTTASRIQNRVHVSIVAAGLVQDNDLDVRVIPIHIHKVLVVIKVNAVATAFNQLEPGQALQTALVFDTVEQQIFFLDKTPQLIAA